MGGATKNHRRKAQILLNNTARWVAEKTRKTKINFLMESLDWLTIQEMILTNKSTIMWKMLHKDRPCKVASKLEVDRSNMTIRILEPRIMFTEHNFTLRASRDWNRLPDFIRNNDKLQSFKKQVKKWVKEQRHLEPD